MLGGPRISIPYAAAAARATLGLINDRAPVALDMLSAWLDDVERELGGRDRPD